MSIQLVKVRRETIVACMTCPLCKKLLREATTISECLHTFCRKCIYGKVIDDEIECCPICHIDLGCVPLEKLRPDHNLQDVRAKIFPFKKRKVKAPEVLPSISLPVKRKERSLSSLVVSAPLVSAQSGLTGRRTKTTSRKTIVVQSPSYTNNSSAKEEDGDSEEKSKSPEKTHKLTQIRNKSSSNGETSKITSKMTENGNEDWKEFWKPLDCLVKAANRTKTSKFNSPSAGSKTETNHYPEDEENMHKAKRSRKRKVLDDSSNINSALVAAKARRLHKIRRRKETSSGELLISSQAVFNSSVDKCERTGPIWFSLVASEEQEGDVPLPQISSGYLRIKDRSTPVSFIQKYLVKKLDLSSEAEVEIKCQGQPVLPTLALHSLVDLWLQSIPDSQRLPASIGNCAKDFIMVLAYARKLTQTS